MNENIEAVWNQIFRDIYYGMYNRYIKEQNGNVEGFKGGVIELLSNIRRKNKNHGMAVLNNAYRSNSFSNKEILSGETLGLQIMMYILSPDLFKKKELKEHLQYINQYVKDLFLKVVKNTVDLYSIPIVERTNEETIKKYIREEVYKYFNDKKDQYKNLYPSSYVHKIENKGLDELILTLQDKIEKLTDRIDKLETYGGGSEITHSNSNDCDNNNVNTNPIQTSSNYETFPENDISSFNNESRIHNAEYREHDDYREHAERDKSQYHVTLNKF